MAKVLSASVGIATKDFEKSGIFPFNSQIQDESDFCPAEVSLWVYGFSRYFLIRKKLTKHLRK